MIQITIKRNTIIRSVLLALSGIIGVFVLYISIVTYPDFLFKYSVQYKNYEVFSRYPFDKNIYQVLNQANVNLVSSEFTDTKTVHKIYLCDSYKLFSYLVPLWSDYYAINYPHVHNIFIASSDVIKNEAYQFQGNEKFTRKLSSLIAHEVTHTLMDDYLENEQFQSISQWQIEGYCESVYYNDTLNILTARKFIQETKYKQKSREISYKLYYFAVTYLKIHERMKFDDILKSKVTLNEVLDIIESY